MPSGGTPLTPEEEDQFLENIRAGMDRGSAAQAIGKTGTMISKMVKEGCHRYNHDFHLRYLKALEERDQASYTERVKTSGGSPPNTTTARGYTKASYITDTQKRDFLEAVSEGEPPDLAAKAVGTSLRQMESRMGRDPGFTNAYQDAIRVGYPMFQERLRAKSAELAFEHNNYPAVKDLSMVHLPEWDKLRTSKHEITGRDGAAIQLLTAALPDLPQELIEKAIKDLEEKKKRELDP